MLSNLDVIQTLQFAIHKVAECVGIEGHEFYSNNELLENIDKIDSNLYKLLDNFINDFNAWYSSSLVPKSNLPDANIHIDLMNKKNASKDLLLKELKQRGS